MSEIPRQLLAETDMIGRTIASIVDCNDDCTTTSMAIVFTDNTFALYGAFGGDYDDSGGCAFFEDTPINTEFVDRENQFNEFKVALGLRTQEELDAFYVERTRVRQFHAHRAMKAAEEERERKALTDPAQYPTLVAKGLWVPKSMK